MKRIRIKKYSFAEVAIALLALLLGAGCSRQMNLAEAAGPQSDHGNQPQQLPFRHAQTDHGALTTQGPQSEATVPSGTLLTVRMQTSVSSANASPGDRFDAVLDEPLVVNGQTLAPRGANVTGRVVAARRSGRLHHPGYLRLSLASIHLNGNDIPLQTSTIFAQGGSHKRRDWAMIGGGAGAGALIGALAGGGKGALIGSAIGAGAGTGTAYATGKKETGFGVERRLSFRLTQPFVVRSS